MTTHDDITRRRVRPRRLAASICIAVSAGSLAVLAAAGPSAQAVGSTPPWEPGPSSVGTITFYNAAGSVITSGSTDTAPFYAYAVGSRTIRSGDVNASITLASPKPDTDPRSWFRDQISSATAYPLTTGPVNVRSLSMSEPVNTGTSGDLTIDDYLAETEKQTDPAYANIYQVRLLSDDSHTKTLAYDDADILVDPAAHTWSQVYPARATVPGAPTAVTAVAHDLSATLSWKAPTSTGGAVISGYDVQYSTNNGTTWKEASAASHTSTSTTETVTGLSNGTSYVFRVAAINSAGTGAFSAKSAAVTPRIDASAFTVNASATIAYGRTVTISSTLTDTSAKKGIGAAAVQLYQRPYPSKSFTLLRTLTTSATGVASLAVTPRVNTVYQWHYAGTPAHGSTISAVQTIAVAQQVSVTVQGGTTRANVAFKIYGVVTPNEPGTKVDLQRLVGKTWRNTGATATVHQQKLPNGRTAVGYIFSVKEAKGVYTFRVFRPATTTNAAGTSTAVKKTVG